MIATPSHEAPLAAATPRDHRTIGLAQAVALYLGAILGAGVLVLPGVTAAQAGPGALLSWAFVGVLGIPLGLTFANLARRYPSAGGVATFAALAFGPAAGTVGGWWFFIAGSVGQAVVPLTGAYYLAGATGLGPNGTFVAAGLILALGAALNIIGLKIGARAQLGLAFGVGGVLLVAILAATPAMQVERLTPFLPHGASAVASATIPLFYAFAGWEVITHLAPEFRDPQRDLVRATLITVAIVMSLYLGIVFAVITTGDYGTSTANRTAVSFLLEHTFGHYATAVTAVLATVIAAGTSNAYIAGTSRLGYALGQNGDMPRWLGHQNSRGVPTRAVIVVAGLAALILTLTRALGAGAEDLLPIPSSLVVATYIVAMAAGIRLLTGAARAGAVIGLLPVIAVAPFVAISLVIPIGVAVAALACRQGSNGLSPQRDEAGPAESDG